MQNEFHAEAKKPYEKPEVKRFPLRPEEAVLGFCKSASAAGASGGNCFITGPCQTAGS
ncbi:MAG: hypothetical protein JWO97_1701 [Acidobacteria bacterium]|nr:hypothetical protein [Acidobacteriota bacterium]